MSERVTFNAASFRIERKRLKPMLQKSECASLEEFKELVQSASGWVLHVDAAGNIDDIDYALESLSGETSEQLERMAPYVKAGSYVQFEDENLESGGYEFDGKKCVPFGFLDEGEDDEEE